MFKCVAAYTPPPAGVLSPILWGDEKTVHERLRQNFKDVEFARRNYPQWHYPFSASELVEFFTRHFGPVKRAFAAIDADRRSTLHNELEEIYASTSEILNDILTVTEGEYLEVIATRR